MLGKFFVFLIALLAVTQVRSVENDAPPSLLAQRLTDVKWQRVSDPGPHFAAEVTTWRFHRNGSFHKSFTSDYAESQIGAWVLSEVSRHEGLLFLASTMSDHGHPARFSVLSFRFGNGGLRLGEENYEGIPFAANEWVPQVRAEDQTAVSSRQRLRFFSLWTAITASDWHSGATPPGDPSQYSFSGSGTHTASFVATHCNYSGTWSLFSSEGNTGEIRLSVPANRCDPRAPVEAFVREIPVKLKDNKLLLYQTAYVPLRCKGGKEMTEIK